ncbi:MAG TPA: PadR family transcriptional regulator [Candidatus Saccharimonadales bacterium]|nr:PadR family transcriptional regulator [Candidatus Saccharimonadales bacterium]
MKKKKRNAAAARGDRRPPAPVRAARLTTPDLVLLSLLAERAMHGYQANLELERREVRDWAGISRPQVYYSLEKLAKRGLIQVSESASAAAGPQRTAYQTTAQGRNELALALAAGGWTTQRERPAFLTWMALSWQAKSGVFRKQLARRRSFLEKELQREETTLQSILQEVGHAHHEAVWMVRLMTEQFRTELRWLADVEEESERRRPALRPAYVQAEN